MSARRSFPTWRRALVAAACLALLTQVTPGSAQTTQDKLNEAEVRVEQIKRDLARQQDRLAAVKAEQAAIIRQFEQARYQKEQIVAEVHSTQELIDQRERRAGRLQDRLDERAREVYIEGPIGSLEFVLNAQSLGELSDRISFLDALSRGDVATAAGVELMRDELTKQRAFLRQLLEDQAAAVAEISRHAERLQGKFEEEAAIEADIQSKLDEAQELVKDLEEKIKREILALLRASGAPAIVNGKGPFKVCPVDPPRSYIDDFGFPRVGHTHQGNDIFAPEGTPIRAPFEGRAEESYNGLGGTSVHVYSPNGDYVYNAHLVRHAGVDGQNVSPGTIIGYVGDTGNAAGTPYHDHFEYHPGGGSAVSPYQYLNLVCGVNGG